MLKAIVILLVIIDGLGVLSVGIMGRVHFRMVDRMGCCQRSRLRYPIGDR